MAHAAQIRFPPPTCVAAPARACSSACQDLPERCQVPGAARDALFMRVMGSPDPYGRAYRRHGRRDLRRTSKCVILSKSQPARSRCRLPLRSGLDRQGLRRLERQLRQPVHRRRCLRHPCRAGRSAAHSAERHLLWSRIWQANIQKTIIAHVPVTERPGAGNRRFRAGWRDLPRRRDRAGVPRPVRRWRGGRLDVPHRQPGGPAGRARRSARFKATMITAGIPTVFVNAAGHRLHRAPSCASSHQQDADSAGHASKPIRVAGALRMGLIKTPKRPPPASTRPRSPSSAPPNAYTASSGKDH